MVRIKVARATWVIGAKSFSLSYRTRPAYRLGATLNGPENDNRSVYPSGAALATASVPIMPSAPARFSTITG